ncbi:Ca-activated chloride channel family protein [Parapedobacter composti]|uniref:Ca-activated chloride channel family protein n=1 Tax=Parapedobacter composti TaxID=623281 RepID=A0A1I1KQ80_9SPHI|nr:VWA domain-containing protein [Parapedobacter composti]SFC62432.1 Ca-activated chloride channel family protein [Parapedobacter composti]
MKTYCYAMVLMLCLVGYRNGTPHPITGTVYDSGAGKPLAGVQVLVEGTQTTARTDGNGRYSIAADRGHYLRFAFVGYETQRVKVGEQDTLDVQLVRESVSLEELVEVGYGSQRKPNLVGGVALVDEGTLAGRASGVRIRGVHPGYVGGRMNTESYRGLPENRFFNPVDEPLSTFAIDVDAASYSNVRRFINNGQLPPTDAVRIEELINYFQYDLKGPSNGEPVAIHTELAVAPWNPKHRLLRIALKARSVPTDRLPPANLVFLLDVSGSMAGVNRLPLAKAAMKMLVDQLRDNDRVAIVTYAGTAGVAMESTPGSQKATIKDVIDGLQAWGSTAGGAGLKLAYRIARQHFIPNGNNRIVLASDGDFNVGPSTDDDMESLIAKERQSGVSLSVLGFGMGNLKDSKMELLANKGHGNYAYIDNITEARKAMVSEFGGTLFTVAKDVKVQVEFNPDKVQAYRLLGYENRLLEKEDFNNDQKLGGDMGVGHTVTALYEVVPAGIKSSFPGDVDPLKYQSQRKSAVAGSSGSSDLATVKFRYKDPHGAQSRKQEVAVADGRQDLSNASADFRFASAVAELGMLLRNSEYKQQADYDSLIARAKGAKGKDDEGYRAEFIRLAESAKLLAQHGGTSGTY